MSENVLDPLEHVMHVLSLEHPTPGKQLHPAVVGATLYYLQKWTKLHNAPPDKIAAKDNGNIAMAWENTHPPVAIDVKSDTQSADILMESADKTVTKKTNEEGTDAVALKTSMNILKAIVAMAFAQEQTTDDGATAETVVGG